MNKKFDKIIKIFQLKTFIKNIYLKLKFFLYYLINIFIYII